MRMIRLRMLCFLAALTSEIDYAYVPDRAIAINDRILHQSR